MASKVEGTTIGALTGLVGALAMRKLIGWDAPITAKEAAIWGGTGLGLGGLAGYGLSGDSKSTSTADREDIELSDDQIKEYEKRAAALTAEIAKRNAQQGNSRGILQSIPGTTIGGGISLGMLPWVWNKDRFKRWIPDKVPRIESASVKDSVDAIAKFNEEVAKKNRGKVVGRGVLKGIATAAPIALGGLFDLWHAADRGTSDKASALGKLFYNPNYVDTAELQRDLDNINKILSSRKRK